MFNDNSTHSGFVSLSTVPTVEEDSPLASLTEILHTGLFLTKRLGIFLTSGFSCKKKTKPVGEWKSVFSKHLSAA